MPGEHHRPHVAGGVDAEEAVAVVPDHPAQRRDGGVDQPGAGRRVGDQPLDLASRGLDGGRHASMIVGSSMPDSREGAALTPLLACEASCPETGHREVSREPRPAMRPAAVTLAAATLLAVVALPSYAAPSPPAEKAAPSSAGLIVWTNRAADGRERLMIADADGTGDRVLTHPGKDQFDIDPQFSPNGEWIAYEHDTPESASVRLVRPDGTQDHRLAAPCEDPCVVVGAPTWLSNRRLAVVRWCWGRSTPTTTRPRRCSGRSGPTGPGCAGCRPRALPASTRTPTSTRPGTGATWSSCAGGSRMVRRRW